MRFAHTWKMYDRVPMKRKSVLPDEGFPAMPVNIAQSDEEPVIRMVSCKPKPGPTERWGHRVMVHCGCGREIPFGRMNQHYPKCTTK